MITGRQLRDAVGDAVLRDVRIRRLETAAALQHTRGDDSRGFLFAEIETAPTAGPAATQATGATLATVLGDLHVANVLMAAGQNVGELGGPSQPALLDHALSGLEAATGTLERALADTSTPAAPTGHFGFAEQPRVVTGPITELEVNAFKGRAAEAVNEILKDAQAVVSGVLGSVKHLDAGKMLEAVGKLGDQFDKVAGIGRLFRQGLERLRSALDVLTRLVGTEAMRQARDTAKRVWERATAGEALTNVLAWVFGAEAARARIAEVQLSPSLVRPTLDDAQAAIDKLAATFKQDMRTCDGIRSAIEFGATIVGVAALIPAVAPVAGGLELLALALYAAVLGTVLLLGAQYTGSGSLPGRVRGVGALAASLVV
ncbi:MAG TPA: hypothetical protein VKV73_20365 [Chloroflexota bacterium]|nr:hypothetical protein [Chloroflexota bacterium]